MQKRLIRVGFCILVLVILASSVLGVCSTDYTDYIVYDDGVTSPDGTDVSALANGTSASEGGWTLGVLGYSYYSNTHNLGTGEYGIVIQNGEGEEIVYNPADVDNWCMTIDIYYVTEDYGNRNILIEPVFSRFIGISDGTSGSNWVYNDGVTQDSGIAHSEGWYVFKWCGYDYADDYMTYYIDNTLLVNDTSPDDTANFQYARAYNHATVTFIDNIRVWNASTYGETCPQLLLETTSPTWSGNLTNQTSTNPKINEVINIKVDINDSESSIDFIKVAHNISGTLTNVTIKEVSDLAQQIYQVNENITNTLSSRNVIAWQVWANDTANNPVQTPIFTFEVRNSALNIEFMFQTPSNITSNNAFSKVNVTYSITDNDGVNNGSAKLYYKINNSGRDGGLIFVNGSRIANGFLTADIIKTNLSQYYNFSMDDDLTTPAIYNYDAETMDDTVHNVYNFGSQNARIKIRFFNITTTKQFTYLEIMTNTTGINPLEYFYCNSSYTTGKASLSPFCNLIYTQNPANTFNHTHSAYSSHQVIPMTINSTGYISGVKVTKTSYIVLRAPLTSSLWGVWAIPNIARANTIQTSTNGGTAWTNYAGTVDAHIHQFSNNDSLYYYACVNDTYTPAVQTCSIVHEEGLERSDLPPTSPFIYNPLPNTLKYGVIPINYTSSTSYGERFIWYNITLLKVLTWNYTIVSNNSNNLNTLFNTSKVADGIYNIEVEACESGGKCSFGLVTNITINNSPSISIISPVDNYNDNQQLRTGGYYFDSAVGTVNCSLYINNVYEISTGYTPSNAIFNLTSFSLGADGIYTWRFACYNGVIYTNSTSRSFIYDTEAPNIIITHPNSTISQNYLNSNFRLDAKVTDDNLFNVNVSIIAYNGSKVYENTTNNLNLTIYNITDFIDITGFNDGVYMVNITAVDDHTASSIPDYKINIKEATITFNDFVSIQLVTSSLQLIKLDANKKTDRYSFEYEFKPKTPPYTFVFKIISTKPIYYRKNSDYKAHFVTGYNWIDFEDVKAEVSVSYVNGEYLVTVITEENELKFNSIGGLNINTLQKNFTVDTIPPVISLVSPVNNSNSFFNTQDVTVSVVETNFKNISYVLWRDTGIAEIDNYYDRTLTSTMNTLASGIIFIVNVTVYDYVNNSAKLFLLFNPHFISMTCKFNENPFMKSNILNRFEKGYIEWLCDLGDVGGEDDTNCISYVKLGTKILQTNPDIKYIDGYGEVSNFEAQGLQSKVARVRFTEKNLLPETEYTFGTKCSTQGNVSGSYEVLTTPTYKDFRVVANRVAWLQGNWGFVIPLIMIISLVILLVSVVIRKRWLM